MSKKIFLTKRKFALVDDCDYEFISQWEWYFCVRYARARLYVLDDDQCNPVIIDAQMHRLILQEPLPPMEVDHINGDGLDNRRVNLRVCTRSNNLKNQKKRKNATSQFKGVYFSQGAWRVDLRVDGRTKRIGVFDTELEAAYAANQAMTKYHGEFARLNDLIAMKNVEI